MEEGKEGVVAPKPLNRSSGHRCDCRTYEGYDNKLGVSERSGVEWRTHRINLHRYNGAPWDFRTNSPASCGPLVSCLNIWWDVRELCMCMLGTYTLVFPLPGYLRCQSPDADSLHKLNSPGKPSRYKINSSKCSGKLEYRSITYLLYTYMHTVWTSISSNKSKYRNIRGNRCWNEMTFWLKLFFI